MPVSPSGVSGISAFHFLTYRSLDKLWIFRVGPETTKTPSTLPLNPRFFVHHLVPHVCPSIWQIKTSRASLWNPRYSEKGNLHEHFARTSSLVMQFSHTSEHTKLMTSLIINFPLAAFYWQSRSCEVIDKSKGDFNSFNCNYFPLCSPPIARLFFEVYTSIFCVLIWQRQSHHTVWFRIFVAPLVRSILEIAVLHPTRLVSIVRSFLKASSSSSRV